MVDGARISLCGLAMLGVIVDRHSDGTSDAELHADIPYSTRIDTLPGQLDEWPHDTCEWYDELQALLDRGLVTRYEASDGFRYRVTEAGLDLVRAVLHPRGGSMESVA